MTLSGLKIPCIIEKLVSRIIGLDSFHIRSEAYFLVKSRSNSNLAVDSRLFLFCRDFL